MKPVRIVLNIADPLLADRLASLLGGAEGIELVPDDSLADLILSQPRSAQPRSAQPRSAQLPSLDAMTRPAEAATEIDLTPREREVLTLLAEGASNKTIARALGISSHTAKFHVGSLIAKLDAIGRTDVVAHAARLGVIRL